MSTDKVTARLDFRLDPEIKSKIDKAAALVGQTVSSFAVSILAQEANRIIAAHSVITLSDRARDSFLARLDQEHEPCESLKLAADLHKESVTE